VAVSRSNTVSAWDLQNGRLRFPAIAGQTDARVSPDGGRLFTFSREEREVTNATVVIGQLWNAITGAPIGRPFQQGIIDVRYGVRDAQFSADGRRILITFKLLMPSETTGGFHWESGADLWDGVTGVPFQRLVEGVQGYVWATFTPDGAKIITVGNTNALLFEAETGRLIRELRHIGQFQDYVPEVPDHADMALSSDGRRLAVWLEIWNLDANEIRPTQLKVNNYMRSGFFSPSFSPDGTKVVGRGVELSGSGTMCHVWDTGTGALLFSPIQHQGRITWAKFSPDGRKLATTSEDGTAQISDAQTGARVCEPLSHGAEVIVGAFSPDSRRLFTASRDGWVRAWDVQTGRPVSDPLAHDGAVKALRFTRDGRWLLTTTDRSLHVWDVETTYAPVETWLLELAEVVVGRKLNEQNVPKPVDFDEFLRVKEQVLKSTNADYYTRWARWFLADRSTRTISPSSSITVPEYVQRLMEENTLESLREAVRLAPDNAVVLARLARHVLSQNSNQNPRQEAEADALSRRALALAPNDPEIAQLRTEVVGHLKKPARP
jgi:WD40 repeat protein